MCMCCIICCYRGTFASHAGPSSGQTGMRAGPRSSRHRLDTTMYLPLVTISQMATHVKPATDRTKYCRAISERYVYSDTTRQLVRIPRVAGGNVTGRVQWRRCDDSDDGAAVIDYAVPQRHVHTASRPNACTVCTSAPAVTSDRHAAAQSAAHYVKQPLFQACEWGSH